MLYLLIDDQQSLSGHVCDPENSPSLMVPVIWVRKEQTAASFCVDRVIWAAPLELGKKASQL